MTTRRTFLKQSLTAAALPLIGLRQSQPVCVCGAHRHDAAGWCIEEDANGDYLDDCTKFYDVHSHDMDMPTGYVVADPLGLPGIYPEAWYPQGEASTPCPPPDPGWRALLGGADTSDGIHHSGEFNIPYYPRGFENVPAKRVNKKTRNWLLNQGVPQSTVDAFQAYSQQFIGNPGVIGTKIDAAWAQVKATYEACGVGSWQYAAVHTMSPGSLFYIVVEEKPFAVCNSVLGNAWAVGQVNTLDYGVKVCIGHITDYLNDPQNATWIRDIDSLLRWEISLTIASRAGYHICTTADEVNLQSPCGLAMKTHC